MAPLIKFSFVDKTMMKEILKKSALIFFFTLTSLALVEFFLRHQTIVQLDKFAGNFPGNEIFHHGKNDFHVEKFFGERGKGKIKVLLLGDSWMEDENLSNFFAMELAQLTKKTVTAINAGKSSYAPTVYLLKSREAYDTYGKFDLIVVNIDETDIGDEWLRYKIPTVRSRDGDIVAVPFSHDKESQYIWQGKLWAENSGFYINRLIKFAFFHKVLVPFMYEFTESPSQYENLMQFVFAPDAKSKYSKEIDHFYGRLEEMARELCKYTDNSSSIYVTHHPHLRGLVSKVSEGRLYLPVVSDEIARLKKATGLNVLDARENMVQIHGVQFTRNTFEEGDPFSHLCPEGAQRYGKWIAAQIAGKLNE